MDAREQQAELQRSLERSIKLALNRDPEGWYEPTARRAALLAYRLYSELFEGTMPLPKRRAIRERVEETLNRTDLTQRDVKDKAGFSAQAIANYVVDAVLSEGSPEGSTKTWVSQNDDRVRPSHRAVDGQEVPITERFDVGGHPMIGPGDLTAPIEEWANCRCYVRVTPPPVVAATLPTQEVDMDTDVMDEELAPPPEPIDEYEAVPWHSVFAPEGKATGDNRGFDPESLSARDLPLPLRWQKQDAAGHDLSVVVGRVDKIYREDGLMWAEGEFSLSAEAAEVIGLVAEGALRGISVDLDDVQSEFRRQDGSAWSDMAAEAGEVPRQWVVKGRICSAAMCAIPAFAEAFLALGPRIRDEEPVAASGWGAPSEDGDLTWEHFASDKPWSNFKESDYSVEQWHRACLVHVHSGPATNKSECKLPVREPSGVVNRNGVHAAAGRVNQTDAPPDKIASAKSALRGLYRQLGEEAPDSLKASAADILAFADLVEGMEFAHDLIFLENRRTPKVVSKGAKYEPKPSEGKITNRRAANADEEKVIARGDWVRVNERGEKPGDGGYMKKKSKVRPQNNGADDLVVATGYPEQSEMYAAIEMVELWDEDQDEREMAQYGVTSNPTTKDGPGWFTHPVDTARLARYWTRGKGAAKIGWGTPGDFNRCRAQLAKYIKPIYLSGYCANRHKDALGFWPGQHRGKHSLDGVDATLIASAWNEFSVLDPDVKPPREWFTNPNLGAPSGTVVTAEGRIYGHVAAWGTCHIGFSECVEPPHSGTDYTYFHTGTVLTDQGYVATGRLTMGTGHASTNPRVTAMEAAAHYDNTGTAVADVVCGEDEHGIWFSGAVRPNITEEQVHILRAHPLSGDWRPIRGGLEMVAALCVNVPGFPIPRPALAASGGQVTALVAAGVVPPRPERDDIEEIVARAVDERMWFHSMRQTVIDNRRAELAQMARK